MTRLLAMGLLLVALSPTGPLVAQSTEVWLIQNEPLQDTVGLRVLSQPQQMLVYVDRAVPPDGTTLPVMAIRLPSGKNAAQCTWASEPRGSGCASPAPVRSSARCVGGTKFRMSAERPSGDNENASPFPRSTGAEPSVPRM